MDDEFNYLNCSAQHAGYEVSRRCDFESNRVDESREWTHWTHIVFINDDWSTLQN